MENREILIANTKTQKRSKITTDATTLAELKAAMDAAGIDYSGMTFTEGISKTQLLDDATQLPQNVMYKGTATNNLVILLTNTKKNIASGACSRKEAYEAVKANNLQEVVKQIFGKNYTVVPTSELWDIINNNLTITPTEDEEETSSETPAPSDYTSNYHSEDNDYEDDEDEDIDDEDDDEDDDWNEPTLAEMLVDSIIGHVAILTNTHVFSNSDLKAISTAVAGFISEPVDSVSTSDGTITDNDVDNMINELEL